MLRTTNYRLAGESIRRLDFMPHQKVPCPKCSRPKAPKALVCRKCLKPYVRDEEFKKRLSAKVKAGWQARVAKMPRPFHPDTGREYARIKFLCRTCHMLADNRLQRFLEMGAAHRRVTVPPKPCVTCGRVYKPLRKGECGPCNIYRTYNGFPRTVEQEQRRLEHVRK